MTDILMPALSPTMEEGTLAKWLKKEGDSVEEGEPLVEIETAKMQTELEATVSGVLDRIVAQEGEIVPIRGLLCVITDPGETPSRQGSSAAASPTAAH